MTKINDTTTFPITTPADDDFVIGTDVSNTTNSVGGETVSFKVEDLRGVGSNQTWQDLTSSRSNNTNYTNTTGKPIMVNILTVGVGNNTASATATVDGTSFTLIYDNSTSTARGTGSFVVPTGAVYKVNANFGISEWYELTL